MGVLRVQTPWRIPVLTRVKALLLFGCKHLPHARVVISCLGATTLGGGGRLYKECISSASLLFFRCFFSLVRVHTLFLSGYDPVLVRAPLSREYGIYKTDKDIIWRWFSEAYSENFEVVPSSPSSGIALPLSIEVARNCKARTITWTWRFHFRSPSR